MLEDDSESFRLPLAIVLEREPDLEVTDQAWAPSSLGRI